MRHSLTFFASFLAASGAWATNAIAEPAAYLQKDRVEIVELLQGRWDNDAQVFFADAAERDPATLAPRQHIVLQPTSIDGAPEGALVLIAERSVDGEPPIRLAHIFPSLDSNVITHQIAPLGAADDDANSLNWSDLTVLEGCEAHWRRAGGHFEGDFVGAGCDAVFPRPVGDGPLEARMTLSETAFWVTARRGEALVEAQLRRARVFSCWTAVLRGAEHGDSGAGSRDWDFQRGVLLHDQGGVASITTDETPPRTVRLRLRDVLWPYGSNRPSLTLYALEGDSDRAVSYAWTEGGGDRIGLNLRWLQASCTYAPDDEFAPL